MGDRGIYKVFELLINNEEQILEQIYCTDEFIWPAGFKKIEINYKDEHNSLEVWEKAYHEPHIGTDIVWTTLFKIKFMPDKDMAKQFIINKLSEEDLPIGPSEEDIQKLKEDDGKMELINAISEKYDGSLDILVELKDKDKLLLAKSISINPEVVIEIADNTSEDDKDIHISIEFDALYNFITYMEGNFEEREIRAPHWVHIEKDHEGGPGDFFGAFGAFRKLWREGVTLRPRTAIFKLVRNIKDIVLIMGTDKGESDDKDQSDSSKYLEKD